MNRRTLCIQSNLLMPGTEAAWAIPFESDEQFLNLLLHDTRACLDYMPDSTTGFRREMQHPRGHTNTTDIELISSDSARIRDEKILASPEGCRHLLTDYLHLKSGSIRITKQTG